MEKRYIKQIRREEQQVRDGVQTFDIGLAEKASRLTYLTERQDDLEFDRERLRNIYGGHIVRDRPYIERWFVVRGLEGIEKEIQAIKREVNQLSGFSGYLKDGFTREEIERARGYPIRGIIEVNSQNKALCVNHEDTSPSMYCKSDFCYCFSCGYKADHIAVMMKVRGIGFQEAVRMMI